MEIIRQALEAFRDTGDMPHIEYPDSSAVIAGKTIVSAYCLLWTGCLNNSVSLPCILAMGVVGVHIFNL